MAPMTKCIINDNFLGARDVSDWLSWRLPRFGLSTCAEHVMCGELVLVWGLDKTRRVSLFYTQREYLSCR